LLTCEIYIKKGKKLGLPSQIL